MPDKTSSEQSRRARMLRAQLMALEAGARQEQPAGMRFTAGTKTAEEQRRADVKSPQAMISEPGFPRELPPEELQMRPVARGSQRESSMQRAAAREEQPFTDAQLAGQALIMAALAAASTAGGGQLAQAALAEKIGLPLSRVLGEAAGAGGFEVGRQALQGQPIDPGQALTAAAVGGGAGALTSGAARVGSDVGGIPATFIDDIAETTRSPADLLRPARGFRATFGSPNPRLPRMVRAGVSDELTRGVDRIRMLMPAVRKKISPERAEKLRILRDADRAGTKIDPQPLIDVFEDAKIGTPGVGALYREFGAFNKSMDFAIKKLKSAQAAGGMKPTELDNLINSQLKRKAFTGAGKPSTNLVGEAFDDARRTAQKMLTGSLPAGVRELNAAITSRLEMLERAERMFGHGRSTEAGVRESTLANAFRPNNTETARLLNFIESMGGPEASGLVDDMFNLAKERAFSKDPREFPATSGMFQNIIGRAMRGVAKVTAPIQSLAGPGASAYYQYRNAKNDYEKSLQDFHTETDREFEIRRLLDEERRRRGSRDNQPR